MNGKRSREEEDLSDHLAKRTRTSVTDLKNGNYFVVCSKLENVHCIFDNLQRCQPYLNREDVSVIPFVTLEDAEHYAKFPFPVNDTVGPSTSQGTEVAEVMSADDGVDLGNDSDADLGDVNDATDAEQTEDPTCFEQDESALSETQLIYLPEVLPDEPPNQVTVFASGTTCTTPENPKMAYGIYFSDESLHNDAGTVDGAVSSQRADLKAALESLKIIFTHGMIAPDGVVYLCIISSHVKSGIELWMPQWKARGWRNANKGPIKNLDLWQEMDAILTQLGRERVRVDVINTSGSPGSFCAGRLAENALRQSS